MTKLHEVVAILAELIVGLPMVFLVLLPIFIISISIIWLFGHGLEWFTDWWIGLFS